MSIPRVVVLFITLLLSHCVEKTTSKLENVTSKVVFTQQGPVRGYKNPANGLFEFYSIPYARAPTKENKFMGPLPPRSWSNSTIFEAVEKDIICLQGVNINVDLKTKNIKEDCLIVNIHVPDTKELNLPVLVYIYGGGYYFGYSNIRPITNLAKIYNVISVNFNYRLGVIGNLCLGTESAPGNAAMRDQIALLRWVNKNIAHFGGDPNKVTLAGCSSGGGSVDLLGLSTATKGLFRNMIVSSGVALDPFAVQSNPIEQALYYAQKLNLLSTFHSAKSLETLYKSLSPRELINHKLIDLDNYSIHFGPCVEGNSTKSVLSDAPYNILRRRTYNQIPILYCYTQIDASRKIDSYNLTMKLMKKKFSDFLPDNLQFRDEEEKEDVAKLIQKFYFEGVPATLESIPYVNYFTDSMFMYGVLKTAELHREAGHKKVYLQEFSYVNERSHLIPNTPIRATRHCSEALAVWDEDEEHLSEEYKSVKKAMREVWANFVKTGEPSPRGSIIPNWPPVSSKIGPVMNFDKKFELKRSIDQSLLTRFNFWDKIYAKHYKIPVPPI